MLLEYGALIDSAWGADECTALSEACHSKHWGIARILVRHGAKPSPNCTGLQTYLDGLHRSSCALILLEHRTSDTSLIACLPKVSH